MWAAENGSAGSNTFCIQKYLETEYWSRFRQYRWVVLAFTEPATFSLVR